MAIDFKNHFAPQYQIIENKKKVVATLKDLAKKNKEIIFAAVPNPAKASDGRLEFYLDSDSDGEFTLRIFDAVVWIALRR